MRSTKRFTIQMYYDGLADLDVDIADTICFEELAALRRHDEVVGARKSVVLHTDPDDDAVGSGRLIGEPNARPIHLHRAQQVEDPEANLSSQMSLMCLPTGRSSFRGGYAHLPVGTFHGVALERATKRGREGRT